MGWGSKRGWLSTGVEITIPVTLSSERFYTFGVLSSDRQFHAFYDKANSDNFLDFLREVHKQFGKCVVFLDNASYHKSKAVLEGLEEFGGDIVLEYFPKYTPELNPVEPQWREQKRHTAGRLIGSGLYRLGD